MNPEKTNWKPVPLALDEPLKQAVEETAKELGRKQADVMRWAIRVGLPLVKAGGAADVLTLDGELSREVEVVAKQREENRNKVLLGAIRAGLYRLPPTMSALVRGTATAANPTMDYLRMAGEVANPAQSAGVDMMDNLQAMTVGGALGINEPGGEDRLWRLLRPILLPRIVEEINARLPAEKGSEPLAGK